MLNIPIDTENLWIEFLLCKTHETSRIWYFLSNFAQLKVSCLVTLFDRKIQVFKNSPKLNNFGIFNELLSTQIVNAARFARNVECDFFCDFRTL